MNIGVALKPGITEAWSTVELLARWAANKNIKIWTEVRSKPYLHEQVSFASRAEMALKCDLIIVLGGDGTMLSVAREIERNIPVLGVNFGRLGYLTEFPVEELLPTLERFLIGDYCLDRRMRLQAELVRHNSTAATYCVLNDVVVNKAALARMIELECRIDDKLVNHFRADGLIVSTPTGSTAYSLSAGGPIIHPAINAVVITPICPHTLTNRPIVADSNLTIELLLLSPSDEVTLTLDGQMGIPLQAGDRIRVTKSKNYFNLLRPANKNFFDILREKLNWGR
ncbi:MAG: NAD(+)/NADH kinase [Acidobacteriota bacterium]|nr:NAD(+)/NADH kinase [Blastocatellia bacterium]MDW8412021.1 NAD(+)/NADH kinase [Acidobacteriota bacterium]